MPEILEVKKVTCFHCGDECMDQSIELEEKYFCCLGCKSVYEILNSENLNYYYELNNHPGKSLNSRISSFDYLDNDDIQNKLLEYKDNNMSSVTFFIPSIHCSSCIWLLENMNKIEENILSSEVNFLKKEVHIKYKSSVSLKTIVQLLVQIGYEPLINLDSEDKSNLLFLNKYYYKLGLAAFCFGNIMLFSFPEYLSIDIKDNFFRQLFGYINILLSVPVLIFSANDFFISAYNGLKKKNINLDVPLSLGIAVLFLRSLYEVLTGTGAGFFDSFTGLVFFLLIGKYFQQKTYNLLNFERNYKSFFPISVSIITEDQQTSIPLSSVKKGDRILIHNNEIVPVDSILIRGEGNIDYSFVTGESSPHVKYSGDLIYAGGKQVGRAIEVEALKEVSQSYLTRLWNKDEFSKEKEFSLLNYTNKVSKYFTLAVILISITTFMFWYKEGLNASLNVFTSVLIVACPCALALSIPFILGNSVKILGRNNIFLKNISIIKDLSKVTHIVFDKTGTITKNGEFDIEFVGDELNQEEKQIVASLCYNSVHPLSRKILNYLNISKILDVYSFDEVSGKGLKGTINDKKLIIGSASFLNIEEVVKSSAVYVSIEGKLKGYFKIKNIYRENFPIIVEELKERYKLSILSGDNESEYDYLKNIINEESLHFNQSPEDKMNFISEMKKNENVLMVGDGLNDAGALKMSNVGLAVTEDVNNFVPACDVIINSKNLHLLPHLLRFSKINIYLIYTSFVISLIYNLTGLYYAATGSFTPLVSAIIMPLSSISVAFFALVTTTYFSKKLNL